MERLHPLHTDIAKPERFTYPFCYTPHPLATLAAEELQRELAKMALTEGKMFGVLVVESTEGLAFLAAYSGLLEGRNDWPYFVPPVFDAQQPDGHFKQTEREISGINAELCAGPADEAALREQRRQMSEHLQTWLFHQYRMLNARGEEKDLVEVWQDYHNAPRIRRRYPLPPGGTGDCCAPKLLQYAYHQGLHPVCMAEFWWGTPQQRGRLSAIGDEQGIIRHHAKFYPACRGKCKPVLTWMLQGLDVDPDPEEAGFPQFEPKIVYEDEAMAVLDKPSGMLSVPGRSISYSVATWAQQRWPGAIPAHRLDMWTSGLMVIAKSKDAYLALQEQFVRHTIKKRYIAVLDGQIMTPIPTGEARGRIVLPLLCDPLNRPRQIVDHRRGKSAVTEYEILAVTPSNTLVALYPHTGRTHQLRVHCAHPEGLGCPIHGDELYSRAPMTLGGKTAEAIRSDETTRLCLHADRLDLCHPLSGEPMHFELPYPFGNLIPYNNK